MLAQIREKLKALDPRQIACTTDIRAAVMVPIFEQKDQLHIVLTKRTDNMKAHPGEISFPGGMYEERDSDTRKTALRECCEEIGVKASDVEIIGRLDDERTLTGFVITPYVGIIPYPYTFKISQKEVAYLIHLPYEHLKENAPVREETSYRGEIETVDALYYKDERIWGATCRILLKLKRIVHHE
jgi:8-oxo-dGTP pyrophosphatase MutT (NUDIX family)